jgi:hypothetical protein
MKRSVEGGDFRSAFDVKCAMQTFRRVSFVLAVALGIAAPAVSDAQINLKANVNIGVKVNAGPTSAPPAPKAETFTYRRGQVWTPGQWQWRSGKWQWQAGRYQARPRNKTWQDGKWENAGGQWKWTAGAWVDAPREPMAPPKPIVEKPQSRAGFTWVAGYWNWENGGYEWVPGKLQRRQRGKQWKDGAWAQVGGRWQWTAGGWMDGPKDPPAPPALKDEVPKTRRGFVWVKGSWKWDDGEYVWVPGKLERRQRGKQWKDGAWAQVGGRWQWNAGAWTDAPTVQPEPPKPLPEKPQFRRGFVWEAGHWEWDTKSFAYEWVPGKLAKRGKGKRWNDGKWENKGGQWTWSAGAFVDAPTEQPAPPAPIAETTPAARRGFVFVKGNYEWRDGDYEWVPGHWEREQRNKTWRDGGWAQVSGKWTWTPGSWQ